MMIEGWGSRSTKPCADAPPATVQVSSGTIRSLGLPDYVGCCRVALFTLIPSHTHTTSPAGLVARGLHWLLLAPADEAAKPRRTLQQQLNDPPLLAFSAIPREIGR